MKKGKEKKVDPAIYEFGLARALTWGQEKIGRFDAFLPNADLKEKIVCKDYYKYIEIDIRGEKSILRTVTHDDKRVLINVSPLTYNGEPIKEKIPIREASFGEYWCYRLKNDKSQKWALIGVGLTVAAIFIDGSFAIGKAGFVLKSIAASTAFGLMILSMACKIIGVLLIYFKGVKEAR